MQNPDNFEIKYWAGGNDFTLSSNKEKRSVRKRLFIVFSFVGVLAIIPMLIYGLSYLQERGAQKITVTRNVENKIPEKSQEKTTPPQTQNPENSGIILEEVLNNDSYWKISKRYCGSGKFYLSIRDQNGGKALYKDDSVTVNCLL